MHARTHATPQDTPAAAASTSYDARINALAAAQHGVIAIAQLAAAGVPPHVVRHRLRRGRLAPLHRGVYLAGPVAGPRAREVAALLACGGSAALSHRTCGALVRLVPPRPDGEDVEVILLAGDRRRIPGVRPRRLVLQPDELTTFDGLPVTTPARTIVDLAGVLGRQDIERAIATAERDRICDVGDVLRLLARRPSAPGAGMLRSLLTGHATLAATRSEAEDRMLALIRKAGLPAPGVNVRLHGFEVDFLWRAEQLVVEVDGHAFHSSRRAFENDRRRDAVLAAAGLRVIRVTWQQLTRQPETVLVTLAQALVR